MFHLIQQDMQKTYTDKMDIQKHCYRSRKKYACKTKEMLLIRSSINLVTVGICFSR